MEQKKHLRLIQRQQPIQPELVNMVETVLRDVRAGKIRSLAIAGTGDNQVYTGFWKGKGERAFEMIGGLRSLEDDWVKRFID